MRELNDVGTAFAEAGQGSERGRPGRLGRAAQVAGAIAIALTTANCGSSNFASSGAGTNENKYGVPASPRVVADGDPIPKGGGRDMVGRPYVVAGRTYVPREGAGYVRDGLASWYGTAFHGRLTANGEIFDRESVAAAHPTLPLPSYTRVTNLQNNRSMIVRVNDRGPYHANRVMDVSERVAEALDFKRVGTVKVRVEYLGRASTRGSDDSKLMASLRTDGRPAAMPGRGSIMLADLKTADPQLALVASTRSAGAAPAERRPIQVAEVAPVEAPAALRASAIEPVSREAAPVRMAYAPVPPERPFDLATIPGAGSPMASATGGNSVAHLPPVRPSYAGLFYAAPAGTTRAGDPFVAMKPQRVVSLRNVPGSDAQPR